MNEGFDTDYMPIYKKQTFEEKIGRYKNTMEFIRTLIGFIVLTIQIFVLIKLYSN